MRSSVEGFGQTTIMVTHEPRAASIADRILFLADGLIVKELAHASAADVLGVMSDLSA
jgi:putative ABC transport system ATP-binding protein